jgi:hypothetical protein
MNAPLLTRADAVAESSRINSLNDALYRHIAGGLEAHDSEGPTTYVFEDSGGNSLSQSSLILGGLQGQAPLQVYVPLAQNPTPPTTTPGVFNYYFYGIKFIAEGDMKSGIDDVITQVEGDLLLTLEEIQAITNVLLPLEYGSTDADYETTVRAVSYTVHVVIDVTTGQIHVSYTR